MSAPRYELVSFDFDGTLADSAGWMIGALQRLSGEFNFRAIDRATADALRRCDSREIMKELQIPAWQLPKIVLRMRQLAAAETDQIRLFSGVHKMFRQLKDRGVRTAIVSSNAEATIRRILGDGTVARVDHFVCGASLFGKAAKLRTLLKRSRTRPERAIYIGDEIRDIAAARAAGMAFGAVGWGCAHPEALQARAPDCFFASLSDIVKTV